MNTTPQPTLTDLRAICADFWFVPAAKAVLDAIDAGDPVTALDAARKLALTTPAPYLRADLLEWLGERVAA